MTLTNYQLILLDNIIYLNKIADMIPAIKKGKEYTVTDLITDLLSHNEIEMYWKDELKQDQSDKNNPG